jgi:hypothetical protein
LTPLAERIHGGGLEFLEPPAREDRMDELFDPDSAKAKAERRRMLQAFIDVNKARKQHEGQDGEE